MSKNKREFNTIDFNGGESKVTVKRELKPVAREDEIVEKEKVGGKEEGGHPQLPSKKTKENTKVERGRVVKKKQKSREAILREREKQKMSLES